MLGAEYLTPDVLCAVWRRLAEWVVEQVNDCGGVGEFLEAFAPSWSRVGRVTVHLAENKGDGEFPFAFMATYAAGLTRAGKLRRLPLGEALREYAGEGKKPELLKLLSPLHAAAKRSELIADLVESGDVFHPLVWTPEEAYAFLREIPVYEECGLLAMLPNWWRKRARPQVNVTLDTAKNGALGRDALLDFRMAVALGDQELSAEEVEALLQGDDGLILLRGEWVEVDRERLREALQHWRDIEEVAGDDGLSFIEGMRLLSGASTDLKESGAIEEHDSWALVEAGEQLRETLSSLRSPDGLKQEPPARFHGKLRDYQLAGVNWLWLCAELGVGACLADDMGLGQDRAGAGGLAETAGSEAASCCAIVAGRSGLAPRQLECGSVSLRPGPEASCRPSFPKPRRRSWPDWRAPRNRVWRGSISLLPHTACSPVWGGRVR